MSKKKKSSTRSRSRNQSRGKMKLRSHKKIKNAGPNLETTAAMYLLGLNLVETTLTRVVPPPIH